MRYSLPVLVGVVVVASLAVVAILYARTDRYPNHRFASFERKIVSSYVHLERSLKLEHKGYYLAGYSSGRVYLAQHHMPHRLLIANRTLTSVEEAIFEVEGDGLEYKRLRVTVDSPYFYLADGLIPFVYRGQLSRRKASPWIMDVEFTKAIPISSHSLALVSISNWQNTILKRMATASEPEFYGHILEPQHNDGVFSTDGMLRFDKISKKLVYVYYYRNEFIVMDTTFQSIHCGRTIDTISVARIKVGKINSKNIRQLAAPSLKVNNDCDASNGELYVQSNILSKSETPREFTDNSVIDVYDLQTLIYQYSFYLPTFNGKKANEFISHENDLYALYGSEVVHYTIRKQKKLPGNNF